MFQYIDYGIIVLIVESVLSIGMLFALFLYMLKKRTKRDSQELCEDEELYKTYGGD
jgi:triphosphoribosyl-dephospho-CoA synthetase